MAELRFTYLMDVKDMASRVVTQANAKIAGSVERTNVAMRQQGTVAENASRKVQTAGARQAAEWKQVERAARTAERSVAQSATQASQVVTKAMEKQIAAQRAAGQSYQQIARQQKAAGVSARETAAAIEQSAVREKRAMEGAAASSRKSATVAAGGMKEKLGGLKSMAGGLAAGFAAFKGLSFIEDAVKETEDLAKATMRLQAIMKSDARTASEWVVLAKERGIQSNKLNVSFIKLESAAAKAAKGSKTQAEAFKALGVSQRTLRGGDVEKIIERVADGMKSLRDPTQRAMIAQQLFGRSAQNLLPILVRGGAAIRELRKGVRDAAASMDANGVKKALALAKAQRELNTQMTGIKVTIGQAIIPYLTRGAQALVKFIAQMRNGTGTGGQVRKVLTQVGQAVGTLATALAPAAKRLATLFGPAAKVAGTAIGGMTQIIKSVVGVVRGMVGVVTNLLKGNFSGAWRSVKKIVSSALSGLGGLVKTLMAPVYTAVSGVVGRALKALGGLGSGIIRVLKGAVGGVASAAGAVAGAVLGAFRTLSRLIAGVWNGIVRTIRGAVGTIKDAVGGITSLPGKVLGLIGGRTGGITRPGGFRRYQQGGLVPAMLSPGEMVVHGGAGMMVPGQRTAADTVPMLLPTGSAVLTGDGQARMAAGASVAQAVASQAPHFAAGGWVRTGATVFSDPPPGAFGSLRGGYAELGTATRGGGATGSGYLARALGRRGELPAHFPLEVKIHGRSKVLRKQDRGYGQGTPSYGIDIWRDSWPFFGIDSSFKGPALVRPADGSKTTGSGGGSSYNVSGLAQAMSRRVGRSAKRAGLVDDAFGAGFAQGTAGLTLSRLRYRPDTAYRDIAGAYRFPAAKTINVPGARPSGRGVPRGGGVGGSSLLTARRPIRDTWAWARAIAGKFGLSISSNYRSPAHNRAVGGVPNSWHTRGSARRPQAFDFVPPNGRALGWVRKYTHPDEAMIHNAGSGLHLHVGGLYRRGGWARFQRGGVTGRLAPTWTGVDPSGRGATGGFPAYGRTLAAALGRAMTWASGTFAKLNSTIQRAAEAKLGALRSRLQAAVRRGGTEAVVKRLQAALDLVDKELGRRAGLLERRITQRTTASDRRTARGDIALRQAGIDPESVGGLTARLHTAADAGKDLWRNRRDMERQLRIAGRARNTAEIARIKDALADNMTAILDSRATQRELGRARDDARKSARLAFVAGLTQIQTDRVGLAQTGRQTLELQQQLAGTYDTGGQARADYITQNVIPALQAEREGLRLQGIEAMRQNNADLARQLRQAWEEKGNDILQAQLDAQEETARNTADTADALKNLGGTLSFEFQGSRLTDDLLSSGVGA